MRGLGSYRFAPQLERKPAVLVAYRGHKAVVRFHDGTTYALPAKPLQDIAIQPDQRFVLIISRVGGTINEIRVEPMAPPMPPATPAAAAKVQIRTGRKLVTRK